VSLKNLIAINRTHVFNTPAVHYCNPKFQSNTSVVPKCAKFVPKIHMMNQLTLLNSLLTPFNNYLSHTNTPNSSPLENANCGQFSTKRRTIFTIPKQQLPVALQYMRKNASNTQNCPQMQKNAIHCSCIILQKTPNSSLLFIKK